MNNTWRFENGNEIKYIKEVLNSGFLSSTSGNMCQRLEKAYCEKAGVKYAIAMNSGTSTMHSFLGAIGVGPGDEVIVPALTVVSTANVVIHQNAVPIFADVNPDTFNIDPLDIERKITKRTKAIIIVALYGNCPDIDLIMKIAKKHKLYVLIDGAESHFAEYKGKYIETLGDACSVSFENSKIITSGDGGIIFTNNEKLAVKMRKFASQGYKSITAADGRIRINKDVFQNVNYKRHDSLGWNYRLPECAAALALGQLEKSEMFLQYRRDIAEGYAKVIQETNCNFLTPQKVPEGYKNSYWCYTCKFDKKKARCSWQSFRKKYMELGGDGIYAAWAPTYLEIVYKNYNFYKNKCPIACPLYKGKVKYEKGLCPITEQIQPTLMQFVNNYEGMKEAKPKVDALRKTIEYFQKCTTK